MLTHAGAVLVHVRSHLGARRHCMQCYSASSNYDHAIAELNFPSPVDMAVPQVPHEHCQHMAYILERNVNVHDGNPA